ncbi:4-hydroxy-3-methylbut-2-enyl diphosphate reductase [Luteolibacter pohnpeiensis]|uniref:4-hydroxy-3-methylbut-2-enyl diphosphate reductase n=1 Tax=Luteolibacter pohnpeiensis TaxID=454153 RepID=A0A934VUM7_9BACT|nr:4-hydroxy-3-methylbut-2-enyl diphosphate reductase [Luteolibacter pohnpeiensis]MBK1881300.1 4-hydroxy-3-methylbut-2-enyl diphosphate reductase [Luteolibacter pohnpeiensis]
MSDASANAAPKPKKPRVNVRRPDVMERVAAEVAVHFHSSIVEKLKDRGGKVTIGNTTVLLAQQFGFCYGVERAIDLAYASRRVFPENRIFLIGEIIHNPDVNHQLREMGIVSLPWQEITPDYDDLTEDDVIIVPAFGAPTHFMKKVEERGSYVVDTTCGDVMKVWRRVRNYAKEGVTSLIHGKANHEETRATSSRALGEKGDGHYLVVLTLTDTDYVCDYIRHGGDKEEFLRRFEGSTSPGFDPDLHLQRVGVANQTTMLKSETEEIQRRFHQAIADRDGTDTAFQVFDTICGATQERQDALFEMLRTKMDLLLVVGGYNSSNTQHLVEIGEKSLPTFFIRDASCIKSLDEIVHYDLHHKQEVSSPYSELLLGDKPVTVGITAGASCPNNLIEETIVKVFSLRGVDHSELERL